jgi:hypothetical protein
MLSPNRKVSANIQITQSQTRDTGDVRSHGYGEYFEKFSQKLTMLRSVTIDLVNGKNF